MCTPFHWEPRLWNPPVFPLGLTTRKLRALVQFCLPFPPDNSELSFKIYGLSPTPSPHPIQPLPGLFPPDHLTPSVCPPLQAASRMSPLSQTGKPLSHFKLLTRLNLASWEWPSRL